MKESYLNMIALVERLHRQFLELVRTELDSLGVQDINNVQALILFNIGPVELTVGELTLRGCYLGLERFLQRQEDGRERLSRAGAFRRMTGRSIRVRLSPKGLDLCAKLDAMHDRHISSLTSTQVDMQALDESSVTLKRLDRFWTQIVDRGVRILPRMTNSAA